MPGWLDALGDDPRSWLLEPADPAVRHLALGWLEDRPGDDPEVVAARAAAMAAPPIETILSAQDPEGWWVKPGGGYGPKYTGTCWSLIFLDQLGADGSDPRIQRACDYVLEHSQASSGGFGTYAGAGGRPAPSTVVHCLTGNLLRALIGFGRLDDERVGRALEWEARAITGDGFTSDPTYRYYRAATSGPGFACAINEHFPCAWGATKAVLGLARVPPDQRGPLVVRAIELGLDFLLSVEPSSAAYPAGWGNTAPSPNWFKLGFPSGYVADVLQVLEALVELGVGRDPRLRSSIDWLLAKRIGPGRWKNEYAYNRKTWLDIERQDAPSK